MLIGCQRVAWGWTGHEPLTLPEPKKKSRLQDLAWQSLSEQESWDSHIINPTLPALYESKADHHWIFLHPVLRVSFEVFVVKRPWKMQALSSKRWCNWCSEVLFITSKLRSGASTICTGSLRQDAGQVESNVYHSHILTVWGWARQRKADAQGINQLSNRNNVQGNVMWLLINLQSFVKSISEGWWMLSRNLWRAERQGLSVEVRSE